jgi:RNA polymerase subunit RPABC4/transcription elongation factor Spt4
MTKLFITSENVDKVNNALEHLGYKADFKFFGDRMLGTLDNVDLGRYASLRYSRKEGFYIGTVSTWLNSEEAEKYAKELTEITNQLLYLENLDFDNYEIVPNRGVQCPSCSKVQSFGDWYGTSSDDFAICPECGDTFTYDELLESADSEESKSNVRDLQEG